jgi:hypothetical protein
VTSDGPLLGFEAFDLLLSIESPGMAIFATALDFYERAGAALAAGAIKPYGFEAVAVSQADHDDAVVNLTWSSELNGYAYFCPSVGLAGIGDDRLRLFKLDISWFLQWIAGHLGFGRGVGQVCLISDRLWDLGDIWLGTEKRTLRKTGVLLARRLSEPETIKQMAAVLRLHISRPGIVILTTTNDVDLAQTIISDTFAILAIKTLCPGWHLEFRARPGDHLFSRARIACCTQQSGR